MHFSIAIRRLLRHNLRRRGKPSYRLPTVSVLISSFVIIIILFLVRPPLVSSSEPMTVALRSAVRTVNIPKPIPKSKRSRSDQALYEPLRNRVNAIVGAGHGARRGLEDVYGLPSVVVANMTKMVATRLYWKLVYADVVRALRDSHMPSDPMNPGEGFRASARVLFVHTQNGLGNRLRAMASGIAMARATGRIPVVVWERDAHLGASFHDLFDSSAYGSDLHTVLYKDLTVMESFPSWSAVSKHHDNWRPVSYMAKDGMESQHKVIRFGFEVPDKPGLEPSSPLDSMGATKLSEASDRKVKVAQKSSTQGPGKIVDRKEHIYFKSAYVAITEPKKLADPAYVNFELMNLRPAKEVMRIFSRIDSKTLSTAIGVHIRSRTLANDNVAVDTNCEYTTEGARRTNFWRSHSQLPVFVAKMKQAINTDKEKDAKFFVAADDVRVLMELRSAFPGRILSIPRDCDDRNQSCILYAMADLLSLSRTRVIYGSHWSSFTESAARLGNKKVLLSGIDFGRQPTRSFKEDFREGISRVARFFQTGVEVLFPWTERERETPFSNCIQ